ncbi:hypothetical protein QAD02_010494 [Eretmocerus hayati]|uniref:Uncharacterized protein n=1 Tax=Eretmocerus hayati TaxID=131215 RepID=A0ACC2NU41_9HYME|nr:hypothetical protein QAD02_010494 [Eretmocerus hayati]
MGDSKQQQQHQHKCKCKCARRRKKEMCQMRDRDRCVRMRQTLVFNTAEGNHYEPYMRQLHEEYSKSPQTKCTPGVELPWDEIAIDPIELKKLQRHRPSCERNTEVVEKEIVKEESCEELNLPWEDLLITDTVHAQRARKELERCDSSLEIPWHDILYDPSLKIRSDSELNSKTCDESTIEIPWDDLLIPKNIVITPSKKYLKKKTRSNEKKCGCTRAKN